MIIRVQPGLGTAIYLQIESQLKHAIAAGALKRDDALPPVRKLAAELRINPTPWRALIKTWSATASCVLSPEAVVM